MIVTISDTRAGSGEPPPGCRRWPGYTVTVPPRAPDLSAATRWLAGRTPRQRKRRGQWVTPYWVCEAVLEQLAPQLPARPTILDPACGDGRWLIAAARRLPGARLVGYDIDPAAIEAATHTLAAAGVSARLVCADSLGEGVREAADAVVGNPPFVRPQHLPRDEAAALWRRFSVATDKSDLYACFVQRALEWAPRVALVLGSSFLSLSSFQALRQRILDGGLDGVFTLPRGTFDAAVDAVVLLCGPSDRREAGTVTPDGGLAVLGALHVGPGVWSTEGPLPSLPGARMDSIASVHMGIVCGDYPRYVHQGRRYPEDRPTCRGRDVRRWQIAQSDLFVRYLPRDMLRRKPYVAPKHAGLFDVPEKVVLAGTTGRRLVAAVDTHRRFPMDSCYVLHPRAGADPWTILGLLLSPQVQAWYGARFGAPRVKGVEISRIPIPEPPWDEIAAAARAQDEPGLELAVQDAYQRTGDP